MEGRECEELGGGGGALVISLEFIPWEQMVNGGLPRCLESKELTEVCVHIATSNAEFEEDCETRLMRKNRSETGEQNWATSMCFMVIV